MDHTHIETILGYYLVGFWFYVAGAAFGEDTYLMGLLIATVPFVALAVWFSKGASKAEAEREEERERWKGQLQRKKNCRNFTAVKLILSAVSLAWKSSTLETKATISKNLMISLGAEV